MEQVQKKKKRMMIQQEEFLDDVPPELIEHIQLKLPSKDAASTCILSKSWLHAWSTSPAIRFCPSTLSLKKNKLRNHMRWIHLTLLRYHRHNLPISSLDLQLGIHSAHHPAARKLLKQALTTSSSSLKDLRLTISAVFFTLPDEIFSNENLNTLRLELISPPNFEGDPPLSLLITCNPPVRCTNLRVLDLSYVHISPCVLTHLLSKNKLLEKIFLGVVPHLDQIKVNNLPFLREFSLSLTTGAFVHLLEIHDTPSLRVLAYDAELVLLNTPPPSFQIRTIPSLTTLRLDSVHVDDAFSKLINSSFPFLEVLTLQIKRSSVDILDITILTLRDFSLFFLPRQREEITVQVSAPNLVTYETDQIPIPLFTTTPPQQIRLSLSLCLLSIYHSFFLDVSYALKLSSKFNIEMTGFKFGLPQCFKLDDFKTIVPHPAANVQELLLQEYLRNDDDHSLLLDTLFSVCHPIYAKTNHRLRVKVAKYFLKLISKRRNRVMEICEIRNPLDGSWVALTTSSLSLLDTTTPHHGLYEFKLSWCSP